MNDVAKGAPATDLEALLQTKGHRRFSRRGLWIGAAIGIVLIVAVVLLLRSRESAAEPRFKTEPATIGQLVVNVSATGNLQPTNQVDVGSELSGIVTQVFVQENDQVKEGQELAQLDLSKLQDAVNKSQATLAAAEAAVLQANATVAEARAQLSRFKRVSALSGGKVPSKTEMDTAEANLKRALANAESARATVTQSKANLQSDETNLYKGKIRSPINGVVLTRKVEPGQTVAASFQAPVLFTIAEDLSKMELQVDVDEADVGQVKVGQKATFTVDAYPDRKFAAVITRVDYGSQEKEGVISYLTVLEVSNDDLSLRPGMTGTAEITTLTREKALLVPNAALRFTPPSPEAKQKQKRGGGGMGALMPRMPRQPQKTTATETGGPQHVWVLRDGKPVQVEVKTGATNGRVTEILGGIDPGTQVITEAVGAPP